MTLTAACCDVPTAALDDDDLVAMMDAGEADAALAELQRRYERRLRDWVDAFVHDGQLAQEVAYESFAKVFLKSHLYRRGSNFQAWLFEVARNHALSKLRDRRRAPLPVSNLAKTDAADGHDLLQQVADPREHREAEEREFDAAFANALEELPERYRAVFEMCVQNGASYKEAARRLDLPTGTVAIRIMRARKRLFTELGRHFDRIRRPPACFN